jgi:tetratricopeptide (TPR) repeat protein
MSKFKVILIVGGALGILAGGTVALFTSGKTTASSSTASQPAPTVATVPTPAAPAAAAPAAPVTYADRAAAFNDQGKNLMFAGKFSEATPMFREAVALVPEPKYFFNLGTSLFQEGKFDEALTALNAIRFNNPTPEQLAKTDKLRLKVLDECKAQKIECQDPWSTALPGSPLPPLETAVERATASAKPSATASAVEQAAKLNDQAKVSMYAGLYANASQLYEQSLSVHPTPTVQFNLAIAYVQQGLFDKAIVLLKKLLASEPAGSLLNQKSVKLLGKVHDECAAQKVQCLQ